MPSNEPNDLLVINNLVSGYGKLPVLHDIDLSVPQGSLTAVIGPNGAGKTTLMNSIVNTVNVIQGEIRFKGQLIHRSETCTIVARGIGYVPQTNNVFPSLSVQENLEMGCELVPKTQWGPRIEEAYDRFPRLRDRKKQKASTLSGGERQMLAIGSALMANPELLILDEPITGLSPQISDEVAEGIIRINKQGTTVIWVVEENPTQVLSVADWVYVMESGTIKTRETGKELLEAPDFRGIFLGV